MSLNQVHVHAVFYLTQPHLPPLRKEPAIRERSISFVFDFVTICTPPWRMQAHTGGEERTWCTIMGDSANRLMSAAGLAQLHNGADGADGFAFCNTCGSERGREERVASKLLHPGKLVGRAHTMPRCLRPFEPLSSTVRSGHWHSGQSQGKQVVPPLPSRQRPAPTVSTAGPSSALGSTPLPEQPSVAAQSLRSSIASCNKAQQASQKSGAGTKNERKKLSRSKSSATDKRILLRAAESGEFSAHVPRSQPHVEEHARHLMQEMGIGRRSKKGDKWDVLAKEWQNATIHECART